MISGIHRNNIRLINKRFVHNYGHLIRNNVWLRDLFGQLWKIQVIRLEEGVIVGTDLNFIPIIHSLADIYFYFEYTGEETFLTSIFDQSTCEIYLDGPVATSSTNQPLPSFQINLDAMHDYHHGIYVFGTFSQTHLLRSYDVLKFMTHLVECGRSEWIPRKNGIVRWLARGWVGFYSTKNIVSGDTSSSLMVMRLLLRCTKSRSEEEADPALKLKNYISFKVGNNVRKNSTSDGDK
ncbi:Uncharacterized protein Fot_22004 [Forsythia ovata]|uniref:Uncharacterized protein n=1 Tax=Forsythia ovata TaxID=205694 RepID=A0ABD1UXH6_9LAMI